MDYIQVVFFHQVRMHMPSLFISIRRTILAAMFPQANRQHNMIVLLIIIQFKILRNIKFLNSEFRSKERYELITSFYSYLSFSVKNNLI
jgi:hypothetical protein